MGVGYEHYDPGVLSSASCELCGDEQRAAPSAIGSAVFVGGGTLAVRCAQLASDVGHVISAAVCADPISREWALRANIRCVASVEELSTLLDTEAVDWVFSLNPFVLSAEVLGRVRQGAFNYHDGPLPRCAGTAATSWALLAHDTEYAVTWHRIDGGAVKGDRVIQHHVLIAPTDTAFTLRLKCYQAGVEGFRDLLNALASGEELTAYPQALVRRSEFLEHRRPDAAGCLRWDRSAQDLSAITRALDFGPYHFNPLCLSKAVVGDDVVAIRCLEVSSSRSSLSAGIVLEIHAGHWRVATGTEDVDVWFVGSDGHARALARHSGVDIGDRLPILSDAEARSITVAHELLAPREEFWRRRLEQFKIVQLPFSSLLAGKTPATWQSTSWLTARALSELSPSDRTEYLLTARLIYLARITGESELQLGWSAAPNGLRAGGRAVEVLLASAVPMVIAIDLSDDFA